MYTYSVHKKVFVGSVARGEGTFDSFQKDNCPSANVQVLQLACVLSILQLAGCASWSDTSDDGSVTTHILGYTKIRHPLVWSSGESPQISDFAHIGVSFGQEGMVLGYGDNTLVSLPPSEHGYLFIDVRSEDDLRRVIGILQNEQLKEHQLCLTINAIRISQE